MLTLNKRDFSKPDDDEANRKTTLYGKGAVLLNTQEAVKYFDEKLKEIELVEKELIEIWEMLSIQEKRNERQFYKFLELQRSVRAMKEALFSMAKHNGYFKY